MADVSEYEYDLLVIGAGSGGVRAARMAAATGARQPSLKETLYASRQSIVSICAQKV